MSNDLIQVMKKAALQVYEEGSPSGVFFGQVISISPLKIQVEQRMMLESQHLVLTSLVSEFDVDMTVDHKTESTSGGTGESSFASHSHDYKGKKTYKIHLGLNIGEKVILLRVQGGQKFIVLDRVRG